LILLYLRFFDIFIVGILSLFGIIYYLRNRKNNSLSSSALKLIERIILIAISVALISTPFLFILKSYTFERFYNYFKPLSGVLIGLSLITGFIFFKNKLKISSFNLRIISCILLTALIIPNIFTIFIYQPILPKENNEYVVDYRSVNTIYQYNMIQFAEDHYIKGLKMGADYVTSWQMAGLTSTSFYAGYLYLDPLTDNSTKASMFLLHYSGIAGPLNEKLEYRTQDKLNQIKINNNIIYDNSQSFILLTRFK
jgi:hypothetical protein